MSLWFQTGQKLCPVCQFEYVRPVEILVNRGGKMTLINHEEMKWWNGEPLGRGVAMSLKYACEGGHIWTETIHFRKGETDLYLHDVGELEAETDAPVIWRD